MRRKQNNYHKEEEHLPKRDHGSYKRKNDFNHKKDDGLCTESKR